MRCIVKETTLAADFAAFTVMHAVCQAKSPEDKDSNGNIEQRCADCASQAKHCQ